MPRLPTISALVVLTAGLGGCASYGDDYYGDHDRYEGRIAYEEVEYCPPPHRHRPVYDRHRAEHRHAGRHHVGHHRRHDHDGHSYGHRERRYSYDGHRGDYRGGRY